MLSDALLKTKFQLKYFIIRVRNYLFLQNYVTSEGAVSHIVLYYQRLSKQLSFARYQKSCYANNNLSNSTNSVQSL